MTPIKFDRDAIRAHVEMLHKLAAGCDGILPLCIYGENPDSGRKTAIVQHFRIGDIEGMTGAALAFEAHPDANVYAPLAVMRRDLPRGEKGGERDVIAVLGVVIDDDADAGRKAILPIEPNYSIQSSAANKQHFILFDRALAPQEAKPIAEALYRACGGDHGTKDLSHVWRIPGTANWPNRKKVCERNRPRDPQSVHTATPWDGNLDGLEHIRSVLAPHMNGGAKPNGHAHSDDAAPGNVAEIMARLGAGLRKLIMAPAIPDEDRSRTLASAITQMMRAGLTDAEIQAVVEAHPEGIGAKYIGRPDLLREVVRLREKFGARTEAAPRGLALTFFDELSETQSAKPWIVKGVIARDETSSWFAPPGKGKSALLTDLVVHTSAGIDWRGYRTKMRSGAVYFALERADLVRRRLIAHKLRDGLPGNLPIAVSSGVIDLLDRKCVGDIFDTIKKAEDRFGLEVSLAIFEPIPRVLRPVAGTRTRPKTKT